MRLSLVLIVCCLAPATAGADSPAASDARRALQALDFAGALTSARAAIDAGGHHADELANLYGIVGEAAAVVEGADAGERAFRAELALAPAHAPPARSSPVVAAPFARARAWVLAHGTLRASHVVAATAAGYRVTTTVDSDPLAMVARRQLWWRDAGAMWSPAVVDHGDFVVPLRTGIVEYYVAFVDGAGNELLTLGDAARPLQLVAAAASSTVAPRHPLRAAAIGVGVAGVALLVTGLALDLVYASDYSHLEDVCGAHCTTTQLSRLDVDRGISISGYATGAGLVVTAAVLLSIDAWQARRRADEPRPAPPTPESRSLR